jgi:hypothetical protein
MPDVVSEATGVEAEGSNKQGDQPESPNDSPLGVYASFPYSPEPFAELSDKARGTLITLDDICTKADVAARRLEVEQAWEALHFERGYQHLLRGKRGGWELPGGGQGKKANERNHNSIYDTNVYGPKGDIIVSALSREVPKVEFVPCNPEWGPDKIAAEEADRFKDIWARNNNLHELLVQCARIFWNEDRALLWTRYNLDGQKYGFEENQGTPTVPEDELNPPDRTPTGQEGQEDFLQVTESESESGGDIDGLLNSAGVGNNSKKPLGMEVTTAHGKLDHKVPISVDNVSEMTFVQLMLDYDVALVRGMFPWIASKINPGTDGQSSTQLDRIARENVRQAVLGAYVTGDSLSRHTTVKFTWMRPSMFLDQAVSDEVKAELLEAFPDGVLLARAGQEYAFSRNEKMDDHIAIGHPTAGKGQNRRAMGTALISVQKRINDWVDLLDDFFKRTIPKKWMNAEAFDMDKIKSEPNMPGSIGPFQPQPGLTTMEQYMMVEPTPQHQPALPDFIKWFITTLSEEISGALPSLFGNATGENTVGNAVIQRDQALQRVGCPWNNIQDLFALAAGQAVKCAAECRDGKELSQNVPGHGNIRVNTANLLGGNVLCYAESNPSIPETEEQKAVKIVGMIDKAITAPATPFAQWVFSPSNLAETASALRMKNYKVPGASSVTKQQNEFEMLLRQPPQDNPAFLKMKDALDQANEGMQNAQATGQMIPPQAGSMVEQLKQAMQSVPPQVSSVQVAQDESENHAVEASECFEKMNSIEGQKLRFGAPDQQACFANLKLHWTEHVAMAKKIAAANQLPQNKPPSESISIDVSKMPPPVAVQALAKAQINATPDMFTQHSATQLNDAVAKKAIPHALEQPQK